MDILDSYCERLGINGKTRRDVLLNHSKDFINRRLPTSLSFHSVTIDCHEQDVAIINTEDFNEKKIIALPGEKLKHGGVVEWSNNHWLITEKDAEDTINERGIMEQCNHLLKWRNEDGKIIEKWVIVEDGTKYLIGEKFEEKMTVGDARIAVTLPKDSDTIKLGRGRRFLIDDVDSDTVLAYEITKPNRLYNIYNNEGVVRHILKEVNTTDNDNIPLRVADYYPPTMNTDNDTFPDVVDRNNNKEVWL